MKYLKILSRDQDLEQEHCEKNALKNSFKRTQTHNKVKILDEENRAYSNTLLYYNRLK